MKPVYFTEKELKTLLWAIQGRTVAEAMRFRENGCNPNYSETVRRLNALSKKIYTTLTAEDQS